jgi:hypothetical protein
MQAVRSYTESGRMCYPISCCKWCQIFWLPDWLDLLSNLVDPTQNYLQRTLIFECLSRLLSRDTAYICITTETELGVFLSFTLMVDSDEIERLFTK